MKILVNFEEKIQTEEKQRRYKFIANQFLRAMEQSLTNRINIVELKQRLVLEEALTPKKNFRKSTQKRFRFDFSIKLTDSLDSDLSPDSSQISSINILDVKQKHLWNNHYFFLFTFEIFSLL